MSLQIYPINNSVYCVWLSDWAKTPNWATSGSRWHPQIWLWQPDTFWATFGNTGDHFWRFTTDVCGDHFCANYATRSQSVLIKYNAKYQHLDVTRCDYSLLEEAYSNLVLYSLIIPYPSTRFRRTAK